MHLSEAEQVHAKLVQLKADHEAACEVCVHLKNCAGNPCGDLVACQMSNGWDRFIAAAAVQIETAKVVDGRGQA